MRSTVRSRSSARIESFMTRKRSTTSLRATGSSRRSAHSATFAIIVIGNIQSRPR
jgi:hypothetical protein